MKLTHLPAFVTALIIFALFGWNLSFYEMDGDILARVGRAAGRHKTRVAALTPEDSVWPHGSLGDETLLQSPGDIDLAGLSDAAHSTGDQDTHGRGKRAREAQWVGGRRVSKRPLADSWLPGSESVSPNDCYPGGQIHWIGPLRDGHREGRWVELSEDGETIAEGNFDDGERVGPWVRFHPNGNKLDEGCYEPGGERGGAWFTWDEQGRLIERSTFDEGEPAGLFEEWYSNGEVRSRGSFVDGLREGLWYFYDPDGNLDRRSGPYVGGARIR